MQSRSLTKCRGRQDQKGNIWRDFGYQKRNHALWDYRGRLASSGSEDVRRPSPFRNSTIVHRDYGNPSARNVRGRLPTLEAITHPVLAVYSSSHTRNVPKLTTITDQVPVTRSPSEASGCQGSCFRMAVDSCFAMGISMAI